MKMKHILSIISISLILAVAGCSGPAFISGQSSRDVVIILVDKTGSTTELEEQNQKATLEQEISKISAGTTTIIAPITANPLAGDRNQVLRVDLPGDSLLNNHNDVELDDAKKDLTKKAEAMLKATPVAQGTDIMDTLRLVADELSKDDQVNVQLYVVSDMMEVTDRANFYDSCQSLSQKSTGIIQQERAAHRLPDLRHAEVHVIGAGLGNQSMTIECRDQVKAFWVAYFEAAGGARIVDYAPISVN